ncbi:MAG: hypothetical protein MUO76_13830 [Anaerolineaceae bacterium]|nr:hypothetical protein [Anaerolineaceae bacterium]
MDKIGTLLFSFPAKMVADNTFTSKDGEAVNFTPENGQEYLVEFLQTPRADHFRSIDRMRQ